MWKTDSSDSSSAIFSVLFLIIVIWAIFGNGFGGAGTVRAAEAYGCDRVSNCQVEKTEIVNTATTQFKILEDGEKTRTQATNLYIADQSEKLFDAKLNAQTTAILNAQALAQKDAENAQLRAQIYTDARFNELERGQQAIACEMPKRPPYYAQGFINCGQPIPQHGCNF